MRRTAPAETAKPTCSCPSGHVRAFGEHQPSCAARPNTVERLRSFIAADYAERVLSDWPKDVQPVLREAVKQKCIDAVTLYAKDSNEQDAEDRGERGRGA